MHIGAYTINRLRRESRSRRDANCFGSRFSLLCSEIAQPWRGETCYRRRTIRPLHGPVCSFRGPVQACSGTAGSCSGSIRPCLGPVCLFPGPVHPGQGAARPFPGTDASFDIADGSCQRETLRRGSAGLLREQALSPRQQILNRISGDPRRVSPISFTL